MIWSFVKMKLIVWLWNPWSKYQNTRHNIWFHFLDNRTSYNNLWIRKYESKYKAEFIQTEYLWEKLLLCKPQTYMNLSWEAVAPLARFYKIAPKDILAIHDEIDFVTARIALKFSWSAAHSSQVVDRVLSSFRPEEKEKLVEKENEIFNLIEEFIKKE